MDTPQPNLTLEESIAQVVQGLPPVIRAYVTEGKYTDVSKRLMSKYGLRVDQAGVLERELALILMGVDTPDEFTEALAKEAALDQKVIADIVRDVNDQIFIPLREAEDEERRRSIAPVSTPTPAPTPPPVEKVVEEKPKEVIRLVVPSLPTPPPAPLNKALPAENQKGVALLSDHEEPPIEFPAQVTPATPIKKSETAVPTPAQGVTLPPRPLPPPPVPATPVTSYTVDPYREPIDPAPGA
jgi:hypothetical protein